MIIVKYDEAKEDLAKLAKSSLWMSAKVQTDANKALEQIFLE